VFFNIKGSTCSFDSDNDSTLAGLKNETETLAPYKIVWYHIPFEPVI